MPATGHAARVEFYLPRRHETIPKRRILVQTYGRRQSRFGLRRQAERDAALVEGREGGRIRVSLLAEKAASRSACRRTPGRFAPATRLGLGAQSLAPRRLPATVRAARTE